ncbi:uncharacterized protein [Montipora foliosa]|uniref:uncharacterized protein n=1 Tax=Montipora foliosa TaxID=591990 RepID=UPI0035F1D03E
MSGRQVSDGEDNETVVSGDGSPENRKRNWRNDGRRRKLNNETSSNRGKKKRCYNCDGFGHMAKVCPSKEGEMEKLQCYRCRGWGHKKSLCLTSRPRPQQKAAKQQEKQDEPAKGKNVFYIYNQ